MKALAPAHEGWAEWWADLDAAARKAAMARAREGRAEWWAGQDAAARKAAMAAADKGRAKQLADMDAAARKEVMARAHEARAKQLAGLDEAARKAAMAAADKGRDERWADMDEAAREEHSARMHEAQRRAGKKQYLPPELLAMATEVNRGDPGRLTYEASCAWAPWVRAYNVRARVTEGWTVMSDVEKAARALRNKNYRSNKN